jgi:hypothetical protein
VNQTCDELQVLAVEGRSLPDSLRAHAESCPECRFFVTLSRNLATGAERADDGLDALMRGLVASGEPLIGRYRIDGPLGRGGQGVVCRATDLETEDEVAVKVVRLPEDGAGRTALEVSNARRVRHPTVCRTYHFERHGRLGLIVMELVDGPTLDALDLAPAPALRVFRAVCEGVQAAHGAGVLHLDLKRRNVLLRGGIEPVVTDFGLSVRVGDGAARGVGGTPAYMAPEQREGRAVDERTDVYALGGMLGELVPEPTRRVRRVVRRATQGDPALRYPDVASLLRDLAPGAPRAPRFVVLAIGAPAVALGLASGLAAVVPPPTPPRAIWRPELWGGDTVPTEAWSVARNLGDRDLPVATASDPGVGCARLLPELLDGVAQYDHWEHGFAFPRASPMCVHLDAIGRCGPPDPRAHLCRFGSGGMTVLDDLVGDTSRFTPEERGNLGQVDPGAPRCAERWVQVDLTRRERVIAVRAWFHGAEETPRRAHVLIDAGDGVWKEAFSTLQNDNMRGPDRFRTGFGGESAPSTFGFPTTDARRVRFVVDPCKSAGSTDWDEPRTPGWLYEVEVFARVSRIDGWGRTLGVR